MAAKSSAWSARSARPRAARTSAGGCWATTRIRTTTADGKPTCTRARSRAGMPRPRTDMRAQLTTLGADGAVGVRIGHVQHKAAEGAHMITVRAIGTAIRRAMPMTGGDRPALAIMPILGLGRGQEKGVGRHE